MQLLFRFVVLFLGEIRSFVMVLLRPLISLMSQPAREVDQCY